MGLRKKFRKILRMNKRYPVPAEEPYENQIDFSAWQTDIKAICFYLPQFHPVPENDFWWGFGFTEWVNARKARPLYEGHYQPREPHRDLGEYDLTEVCSWEKQIKLAKAHGIHGFCFYYYYFNGRKPLERPLKLFLEHPELDINFCLCWANESWARTWDGLKYEYLIKQNHHAEDDIEFIKEISVYLKDPRYIRIDGRPLILIYDTELMPDPAATAGRWRTWCRENGVGEICLTVVARAGRFVNPFDLGFDQLVEFPPHPIADYAQLDVRSNGEFCGEVYDYEHLVNTVCDRRTRVDELCIQSYFRSAMLHWDNSARRGKHAHTWENFSYELYYKWLRFLIQDVRRQRIESQRYIFINAWNEWAEGTYLEPDQKHGYKALNTTSKALFDLDY